jgi:predicted RNase H-like HicB family nuclease
LTGENNVFVDVRHAFSLLFHSEADALPLQQIRRYNLKIWFGQTEPMLKTCAVFAFWSSGGGCLGRGCADLKSCPAFGAPPEEAVAELRIAMQAWLGAAKEKGMKPPLPQFNQPLHAADNPARTPS